MTTTYFTLTDNNSNAGARVSRKFATFFSGGASDHPRRAPAGSSRRTIEGVLDVSYGATAVSFERIVRIKDVESASGYGDKDDLEYFFNLRPGSDPSNLITLADYSGTSYVVILVPDKNSFEPKQMSFDKFGGGAIYSQKCIFLVST